MFLHCFQYAFKNFLRNKTLCFWIILFPIILGTLFNTALVGIYDNDSFQRIPIAVDSDNCDSTLKTVLDSMSKDDSSLFDVTYTPLSEAQKLCVDGSVKAVLYKETASSDYSINYYGSGSIELSIVRTFLRQYQANVKILEETAKTNPLKLVIVMNSLMDEASQENSLTMKNYTEGNMNPFITYMYNLLAMACFFVSLAGQYIAINNQANLSIVGARISIAPVKNLVKTVSSFLAALIIFYLGIAIATLYLIYVLNIDMGLSLLVILFINLIGSMYGISMGFFVGSIGTFSESIKTGIVLLFTLGNGFLSGLMAGDIPAIIEQKCPLINRINPMHTMVDSFYSVSTYGLGERFYQNIAILLLWIFCFLILGSYMVHKRKYQSI